MQAERSAPKPASEPTPTRGRRGGERARSAGSDSAVGDLSSDLPPGRAASAPPPARDHGFDAAPNPSLAAAHARILRVCSRARLPATDAQDVAQDVWLWLIESGRSAEAASLPWLGGVAVNFVRRHWRARYRRIERESRALAGRGSESVDFETRLSFDEMERRLPEREAQLLRLLRLGASFSEASNRLRIPRGSHDYYRKRLYTRLFGGLVPDRRDDSESLPAARA
jgi:DNA-directed RNA polymerase specialized sigma24 family protein